MTGRFMSASPAAQAFRRFYTEMQIERGGLFATMARALGGATVRYPGSSFHIAPWCYTGSAGYRVFQRLR
jgi:hypothetical protein